MTWQSTVIYSNQIFCTSSSEGPRFLNCCTLNSTCINTPLHHQHVSTLAPPPWLSRGQQRCDQTPKESAGWKRETAAEIPASWAQREILGAVVRGFSAGRAPGLQDKIRMETAGKEGGASCCKNIFRWWRHHQVNPTLDTNNRWRLSLRSTGSEGSI